MRCEPGTWTLKVFELPTTKWLTETERLSFVCSLNKLFSKQVVQSELIQDQTDCWVVANVFQLSCEERKSKVVSDMEEHLSELRLEVEQLKQHVDPAAVTKYNNLITYPVV